MIKNYFYSLIMVCALFTINANAEPRYVVCGPDEDGCSKQEGLQYCACIPYDERYGASAYCLDFNNMTCSPLAEKPDCDDELIFPTQANCLATIFQSEPEPACKIKSQSYCVQNHMYMCNANGNPKNCKPG